MGGSEPPYYLEPVVVRDARQDVRFEVNVCLLRDTGAQLTLVEGAMLGINPKDLSGKKEMVVGIEEKPFMVAMYNVYFRCRSFEGIRSV